MHATIVVGCLLSGRWPQHPCPPHYISVVTAQWPMAAVTLIIHALSFVCWLRVFVYIPRTLCEFSHFMWFFFPQMWCFCVPSHLYGGVCVCFPTKCGVLSHKSWCFACVHTSQCGTGCLLTGRWPQPHWSDNLCLGFLCSLLTQLLLSWLVVGV